MKDLGQPHGQKKGGRPEQQDIMYAMIEEEALQDVLPSKVLYLSILLLPEYCLIMVALIRSQARHSWIGLV